MFTTDGVVTDGAGVTQQGSVDPNNVFQQAIDSQAVILQAQPSTAEKRGVVQKPTVTVTKSNTQQSSAVATLTSEGVSGDQPPADGTFGKTDYIAANGDTIASVAAAHGQSVSDILLANPELDIDSQLKAGDNITILDSVRLANARAIAGGLSGDALVTRIREELLYASGQSATPADLLDAIQSDLLRLRPGDEGFAETLGEQAAWATELWKSQGRTHEIMDALQGMVARGDAAGIKDFVLKMFGTVAASAPTAEAIEGQRDVLLRFGPQSDVFRAAVAEAETEFLVTKPQQAAQDIADTFANEGALAAGALLRAHTEAGTVDPLSAALILKNSQSTIEKIVAFLNPDGTFDPNAASAISGNDRVTLFGHLSSAVDSAARSSVADSVIVDMARLINEEGYTDVWDAARSGDGITLALEMITQSDDADTKFLMAVELLDGIEDFKAILRASVGEFVDSGLIASEPGLLWGSLFKDPEYAFNAVLDAAQDGKTTREALAEDVSRISSQGYQMMRMVTAMRAYAPRLEGFENLIAAGTPPAAGTDPIIETALGATPALLEALRAANVSGIENGTVLDPYKGFIDPGSYVGGKQSAVDVSGNPLGVGVALHTLGTEVLGVTNDAEENAGDAAADSSDGAGETGWDADTVDELYDSSTTLQIAQTISALLGYQLDLTGLTQEEIDALPILQYGDPSSDAGLLNLIFYNHLQAFSWFNIVNAGLPPGETSDTEYKQKLAPVIEEYFASTPLSWIVQLVNTAGSIDAKRVVRFNAGTYGTGAGALMQYALDDQHRVFSSEINRKLFLDSAGLKPEISEILATSGESAPALVALSDHLQLGPGALLSWLNNQDADWVSRFVTDLASVQPQPTDSGHASIDPSVLDSIVSIAASGGHPLPGSRLVH